MSCFRFCIGILIERARFDRISRSMWVLFIGFVLILSVTQVLWYISDIFGLVFASGYVDANGCPLAHYIS